MRTLEGRLCLTGVVAMCALVAALPGSADVLFACGPRQLGFDPATSLLSGMSDAFLAEASSYRIPVRSGIRDTSGRSVRACAVACVIRFTTRTASGALARIRQAVDLPLS